MYWEIPVPPDDLDQMTAVRTDTLRADTFAAASTVPTTTPTTPRPATAPTIASAPVGDRAQWLRELLEYTAACEDPVEQQRCRRSIVTEYLPVARSLASRYSGRGVERNDLEQLAFLGLVKAVRRWQPGRSEDFLQFAVPTIVGEIKRYFRDHSWLVRPPRRIQELRAAISEAEQTYRHSDGTGPSDAELAEVTGVTPHDIDEARAAAARCRPRSLDEDQGSGVTLAVGCGDEDPEIRRVEDRITVERLLATLTEREREVVRMRFSEGWSQSRIGTEIGVSQMQVSRWLRTIADKLRVSIEV
jgi:RNA polymerase sigma-B factor